MPQETTDRELIARVADHDQAALRLLIGRHQLRVYRFLLRIVRSEAIAEELTNEVFMEVWRNAKRFEGNSAPQTWVLSIAHHRAVSSLRKRREFAWDEERALELAELERVRNELIWKWQQNPQAWEDFPPNVQGEYLMLWPGQFATKKQEMRGVVVPSSMRQVDARSVSLLQRR